MPAETHDPRDIPILTRTAKESVVTLSLDAKAVHAAILTETLEHAAAQEDPKDHG